MAHRIQRRAVRHARHAAHRGLVALRAAALGLTVALAPDARAQAPSTNRDELIASGLSCVSEWWGAGGRPGWIPDGDLALPHTWTLAGLVAGAWSLEEGRWPWTTTPSPGATGAEGPLAWSDTLRVSAGEGGAWEGFDASLARARAGRGLDRLSSGSWPPRTDVSAILGARGMTDQAIGLSRGDSLGDLRVEAASGERRNAGGFAGAGRDLYGVGLSIKRGGHRASGAWSHRRANAQLNGGESQEARTESGGAGYRYRAEGWELNASARRGYDRHDSRGGPWAEQRRLSDATAADLAVEQRGSGGGWGMRAAWSEARVRADASSGTEVCARTLWGAGRWQGPAGEGDLELALGVGHHDALDRLLVAPSLAWRFRGGPWDARVALERLPTAVWADLAAGERPFLQDTWAGGIQIGAEMPGNGRARIGFLAGHTTHRAVISRIPLEAIARREGLRGEPGAYDFGLLSVEAIWRTERWAASIEGFAMARDEGALQPRVDPGRGARASLEGGLTLFGGDLHLRPRVEGYLVGPRESEAVPSRRLPTDGTFGASFTVELGDAMVLLEGRNLLDRRIEQVWVDRATGREAVGPGTDLRLSFHWRLWD